MEHLLQHNRTFGRRKGRKLSNFQQACLEKLLPKYLAKASDLLAPNAPTYWLEIGSGYGEHAVHLAQSNPEITIIACEPYLNGIANSLALIEQAGLTNIKLWPDDAFLLLDQLDRPVFRKLFLLFPDPWPKLKHHKRRIVNQRLVESCIRILAKQAEWLIMTDHSAYKYWIELFMLRYKEFSCMVNRKKLIHINDSELSRYCDKAQNIQTEIYEMIYKIN